MVQNGISRKKWTLDGWNAAFDWGTRTSKDAEVFLLDQGINLSADLADIPVEALRCVGVTYPYEAGRIPRAIKGGAGGGLSGNHKIFRGIEELNLNDRNSAMETSGMHIYVQGEHTIHKLKVVAGDFIWLVKCKISAETGA
jgi:hypothetical protein